MLVGANGTVGFAVIGIIVGYTPPKRIVDTSSVLQTLKKIDWTGSTMLTAAITMFVAGLNLVSVYQWVSGQVLGPLVAGTVMFISFGLYEIYGTKTGIITHELFRDGERYGRSFALFCVLFFIEGIMFFAVVTFYPAL